MRETTLGGESRTSEEKRELLARFLREKASRREQVYPLSYGQQALWFLYQSAPFSHAYNAAQTICIRSPINYEALKNAFQKLVHRHPVLRSTFAVQSNGPVQIIHGYQDVHFEMINASQWTTEELKKHVIDNCRMPFDLKRGPVFRVSLFTRNAEDHVLLINLHHIICDAWSIWLLMHELRVIYPAICMGESYSLPELSKQYWDYIEWQNQLVEGPEGIELWDYWCSRLTGEIPALELPIDKPRPSFQRWEGSSHDFQLSPELKIKLIDLSKSHGATLYMTLLAAFQILLHRYSGQDEICVGSPTTGRSQPEFMGLVGYFVNPVVLKADLSVSLSFESFLSQVRHTVLDALTHQDYPFSLLVDRLHPKRDPSRSPLFQVMFILQKPPQSGEFTDLLTPGESGRRIQVGGMELEPYHIPQMEGQFDLTLEVTESGEGLHCIFKYRTDLFESSTIRRFEGHFRTLLEGIVANPKLSIDQLPLLTDEERTRIVVEWNATKADYPRDRCLHEFIETQVERSPDAPAVIVPYCGEDRTRDRIVTYRELNCRANQLANRLRREGVGPDVLVGVCFERSLEMVVGLLGVLKSGGAYVPLDPGYPRERLAFMVIDARVPVLLTQRELLERIPPTDARIICLDDEWDTLAGEKSSNPSFGVKPDRLAYVIYTSGSTGQPKGAMNTHAGISNRLLWMQEAFRLDFSDRVLQKTPFSFDVSVWEFFWPLMTGACVVMAQPEGHRDNAYLVKTIQDQQITTLHFVPSMLQQFLHEPNLENCRSLKRVICSGEALLVEHQERFFERLDCELHNLYGPTEAAVDVTQWQCRRGHQSRVIPIGRPIANIQIYILDRQLQPVPVGVAGELHIGGIGLARGYWNRPELTAEKFISNPFSSEPDAKLYKTGDLARYLPDGNIEYLGRLDTQVKVRGFRVELGEIESALRQHSNIRDVVVSVKSEGNGDAVLVAYVVSQPGTEFRVSDFRRFLSRQFPDYMVPSAFLPLESLPLTPNGKIDRKALPDMEPARRPSETVYVAPQSEIERTITEVWRDVLQLEKIGVHDNFFELGGHSIRLAQVHARLRELFRKDLTMVELFQYPTIHSLAVHLSGETQPSSVSSTVSVSTNTPLTCTGDIAVVGMACRFPGASDIETYWANLRDGVESVTFFTAEELIEAGIDRSLVQHPDYVKAKAILNGIEEFDASFFGYTPREAEIMDVQHRLFLECAWEALENAGLDPDRFTGRCGVYAGTGMNTYLLYHLMPRRELLESMGDYQLMIANDKDYLPTRVSYKFNLKGPSVNIQTACSTSLVAIHLACRALWDGECDAALAGGVSIHLPWKAGYLYKEGMILSPDGHCRAFDGEAKGIVGGDGVGVVMLKRLKDALRDGDNVQAVIKGSAINNDGGLKAGYTAPSVEGQTAVITEALRMAGIEPETIGCIEAHGTGTVLGDPIEIQALKQVFMPTTDKLQFCAIGSVKSNFGHLDAAAGVAGFIKTVLTLKHQAIPPSIHFKSPNPQIDFQNSPFYVNEKLREWKTNGTPRRAGVSSFGIGGTNAHVVLEEAPVCETSGPSRSHHILLLSAKTSTALEAMTDRLADALDTHSEMNPADVAFTLGCGRRAFEWRRVWIGNDRVSAVEALRSRDRKQVFDATREASEHNVVFMCSGQGAQYAGMGRKLYENEARFREIIDGGCVIAGHLMGIDLCEILYPNNNNDSEANERLKQTAIAQPALFIVEYALARLWMEWGVKPDALIGHSIGEYTASCLADVFEFEDAVKLVVERGKLMQQAAPGSMLAVPLSEEELKTAFNGELSLAAVNGARMCVISGHHQAVDAFHKRMTQQGIECRLLNTSHAFHSAMMDPIVDSFIDCVSTVSLKPPRIPIISNVSGNWMTEAEATDPAYWGRHLRHTVRFADGLAVLMKEPSRVFLEIGPGNTLQTLAIGHAQKRSEHIVLHSMRHPREEMDDLMCLLKAVGQLWLAGGKVDWKNYYAGERRRKVALPTYPFERQRYWIDPPKSTDRPKSLSVEEQSERRKELSDWFWIPSWKRSFVPRNGGSKEQCRWLILTDDKGGELGSKLIRRLRELGHDAIRVRSGNDYARVSADEFVVSPGDRKGYEALFDTLAKQERFPQRIVHGWLGGRDTRDEPLELGFFALLAMVQALGERLDGEEFSLFVLTHAMQHIAGEATIHSDRATVLGPVHVIPREYPSIRCRSIDVALRNDDRDDVDRLCGRIIEECLYDSPDPIVAYRDNHRWIQQFEPVHLEASIESQPFRQGGVYLITGGFGGLGLTIAEHLARTVQAKLVLTGRTEIPPRDEWRSCIESCNPRDPLRRKLERLLVLDQTGADILLMSADVTDWHQMRKVRRKAEERFGTIHGVIHAAGTASGGMIQRKSREDAERILAAKVEGTNVLAKVFQDSTLDCLILFSSLTSELGEFGQVDYAAANAYLDRFSPEKSNVVCINWDTWQDVGMAADTEVPEDLRVEHDERMRLGIRPTDGVEAMQRILASGLPRVLVSACDFNHRLNLSTKSIQADAEESQRSKPAYQRPDLKQSYTPPETETERELADIWQGLLGIEQIGIHDDFFELGGHSLLATQVASRIRSVFQVSLSLDEFFERRTIAQISEAIAARRLMETDDELLSVLLDEVDSLSEEQVREQLSAQHRGERVSGERHE